MGAFYDEIPNENLIDWIKSSGSLLHRSTAREPSTSRQKRSGATGYDSFNVVSRNAVWYQDMTGSGNETISHLREPGNGRLTIMFTAFEGPPRILRLFGRGKVFERDTAEYNRLLPIGDHRRLPGSRAVIWLDIDRVGTSCGYSVPFYDYVKDRDRLKEHYTPIEEVDRAYLDEHACENCTLAPASQKGGMRAYWELKNAESVDGLPGIGLAGFPPKDGAIRKARKGVTVAYGRAANASGGWVQEVRKSLGTEWRFELGLVAGVALGVWIGTQVRC
ncbi:hypothetical protein JCM10908_006856 [Rhodotorula pacifica]|uniref:uncharacterized protein n=1 Tax=Rhodotorula pacifica TaxID=1495444 RepID=UPI00316ED1C3